ncbi:hypothetical protein, partial [Prevotella pectinovora]|uniref:hypothetical protein n=1 Tax=Prevotella pectinovora TaxID=1602169 RepID=UPI003079043B
GKENGIRKADGGIRGETEAESGETEAQNGGTENANNRLASHKTPILYEQQQQTPLQVMLNKN